MTDRYAPTVAEAIESRRSIRDYEPTPIPSEDLHEILRLTSLAPSSSNLQPWRFVVVTDPEARLQLKEAAFNQRQVGSAPAAIIVYADGEDMLAKLEETAHPGMRNDPAALERYLNGTRVRLANLSVEQRAEFAAGQAYIAIGYLTLAARGLGYDTSIIGGFDHAKVKELAGIPAHAKVVSIVTIGRASEAGFPHHRHAVDAITRLVD